MADLARLGHRQELEAVETVGVVAQVGRHHLGRLLLGLAGLLEDRRLLSVEAFGDLSRPLLGLHGLLLHSIERLLELVVVQQAGDLVGCTLCRLGQADDLADLRLEVGEFCHCFLLGRE